MSDCSMSRLLPGGKPVVTMPLVPGNPRRLRWRRVTWTVLLPLMMIAVVPLVLKSILPTLPVPQSMVTDWVMVSGVVEYRPLLRHRIEPKAAVWVKARWNVKQGNAWVQAFPSLPVADTKVFADWAWADVPTITSTIAQSAV